MTAGIMVVTYNRLELTKKTFDNLSNAGFPYHLIVVDNGSTDGTVEYLFENSDLNTDVVFLEKNKGIAIGRNIALEKANTLGVSWYCTIDNDVIMPDGWLKECIDILTTNKDYGAIGVNMEGTPYPLVTRNGYTFQNKPQGNLGTACMVFSKQLHKMIGYFNTEYGAYGEEDADFGMRARVAGFKLGYIERMGTHLGEDDQDQGDYRKFKTKQHQDNLNKFRQNCALYAQRKKAIYLSYKE
jgi:GT2 family glycosyltransferase